MKKLFKISAFFLSILSFVLLSQNSYANVLKRVTLGNEDAKVTIYDFTSLACIHCATFHNTVFPEIKKNYIDKGLVKVVFMDVPFGSEANLFAHSLLYQTKNPQEFFTLATAILQEQRKWQQSSDPIKLLSSYARLIGINDAGIEKAKNNKALHEWLQNDSKKNLQELRIDGTPTIIIIKSDEKLSSYKIKLAGVSSYSKVKSEIDKLLK